MGDLGPGVPGTALQSSASLPGMVTSEASARKRSRACPDNVESLPETASNRLFTDDKGDRRGRELPQSTESRDKQPRSTHVLLYSQFWPIPSMSRRVINSAKLCISHPFGRIKWIDQWAVDRDPVLTATTSAKGEKTAISRATRATGAINRWPRQGKLVTSNRHQEASDGGPGRRDARCGFKER